MNDNETRRLDWLVQHPVFNFILPGAAVALVLISEFLVFAVVPGERVMGAVQRVFYFHVGAAIAAYFMIAVVFAGSCLYLVTRRSLWDALAESAASVAFLLCSIVLLSGMIWGHSAWNTWWRWEPRLVTSLMLWLILLSYIITRRVSASHERRRNFAAVLGIVSAVNVPIVIFSIQLLEQTQQLHPQVVAKQGLQHPAYWYALACATAGLLLTAVWLASVKTVNKLLELEAERLLRELQLTARRWRNA